MDTERVRTARGLVERDRELATLDDAARDAAAGSGSVVLIFGEAGLGKSSLLEAASARLPREGRLLVGYCDDLAAGRTLGPFRDMVGSVGAELASAVRDGGDRDRVLSALRNELARAPGPTMLAVEDVHWADEATLDVLRYLVRRIAHLPVVLVMTYREDELTRDHALQHLLGLVSMARRVHHLPLRRLSEAAVTELSAGTPLDPARVYSVTAGNPFFVAEVLAAGTDASVPPTIVDAVLARVRKLDKEARETVEQLSVVPSALERWLVDALVPAGLSGLVAAEERRLLTVSPARVAFRHELTRRAVTDSLPAARRIVLNRSVLEALTGHDGVELSRVVHHAREAGDANAIVRYGPAAAREAAQAGSHRQAASHYRAVLEHRDRFSEDQQADLLEAHAVECYTLGAAQDAVEAQAEAVDLRRRLGHPGDLGSALRWLSRMHWWNGDRPAAEATAVEAIHVLDGAGDPRLLAAALSNWSQLLALAQHGDESFRFGERAAALARQVGDRAVLSHALTNIGMSRWSSGQLDGQGALREALRVALSAGETEHALRAYVAICSSLLDEFRLDDAKDTLAAAIELADRAEQVGFLGFLTLERARLHLHRAAWDRVRPDAEFALNAQAPMRWGALLVCGRMRVRLGQPGGEALLRQAWDLSLTMGELQRTGPVAAALAEAAWLRGDFDAAREVAEPVYQEARDRESLIHEAELGYWLRRAGVPVSARRADHPYLLQSIGRLRDAAAAWRAAGAPYEHAVALAESDDTGDLLAALEALQQMGAGPMARIVRRRLRDRGVTHIPKGPSGATRQNPAGLTDRQTEVLRLVAQGLTNAEIADRLVVSVRTVDSHVAAVLDKLGTPTRRDAAIRATELQVGPP